MEKRNADVLPNQTWSEEENLDEHYFSLTQDSYNNVDVVWDWNSPQTKPKPQPRYVNTTPKVPLKRHPSNSQGQSFEKLKEELQMFKEELLHNLNKNCSNNEKNVDVDLINLEEPIQKLHKKDQNLSEGNRLEDIFNDSIDEQLELFSQQLLTDNLEEISKKSILRTDISCREPQVTCNYLQGFQKQPIVNKDSSQTKMTNLNLSKNPITRTKSEDPCSTSYKGNSETFQRTRSFEIAECSISKEKLAEIEKKRLEAKAKLKAKRQLPNINEESKCSPGEIERKRLTALAKLEAKRQQDLIEKKHKEALERLKSKKKLTFGSAVQK